jgi:alpha-galactosidase
MKTIRIEESGLKLLIEVTDEGDVRLLHFSILPYEETSLKGELQKAKFRLTEVQVTGENYDGHHGAKHLETLPGKRMKYRSHRLMENEAGQKLELEQYDPVTGLKLVSHLQCYRGIPVVRSWSMVENEGNSEMALEYISSFALNGLAKEGTGSWGDKMRLHVPHHSWYGELQWRASFLPELGLTPVNRFTMKRIAVSNTGTWSTAEYLPMGCLENVKTGTSLFWQIEHNGSWHWEIGDYGHREDDDAGTEEGHLYLRVGGPTEAENHWWKKLKPGESFTTVPVAVGTVQGGLEDAAGRLTEYRRRIRRPNRDNEALPVIFNDYMNCLFGDPTAEKLYPLIDAAAETGCEYFCIDAGWYADGAWWDGVGEWQPSAKRFPEGLEAVLEYIRSKGMAPGLWLEIEVMGVRCPLVERLPDDWFFVRHGKRVADHGRYQLDFRHPGVRKFADTIIERFVKQYKVGYIKMDYNINIGIGTELGADSFGDGLLQHNRAYLEWLDEVFARYPELVIEHCSSGGLRMDYALLQRHSLASISDQTDYRKLALIAAASPTALTPEQAAVWSYPLESGDEDEVVFNMVNALLLRIHLSGHLARMEPQRRELIREAIDYYKEIRTSIAEAVPFWPLGLPRHDSGWTALGLQSGRKVWLAVWRLGGGEEEIRLPLPNLAEGRPGQTVLRCAYPAQGDGQWIWDDSDGLMYIRLQRTYMARLFELVLE